MVADQQDPAHIATFIDAARAFLDNHAAKRPPAASVRWGEGSDNVAYFSSAPAEDSDEGWVAAARTWQRTRYDNGFGWITGPAQFGGRDLSTAHQIAYDFIESEYDVPDTSVISLIGLGMIGPTILVHGTDEQRSRYLPAMYRGDLIACQLFSEPGAGSDLASVSTKAVRDGDEWVLNGQKVWTSIAQQADFGMALTRTNSAVAKHRGITVFLVDLSTAGVDIRPLRQMTGDAEFNEVFLTDVRVSEGQRLGEVDRGWGVTMTTLMNERVSVGGEGNATVNEALVPERLAALLEAMSLAQDGALRHELAGVLTDVMATQHFSERIARTLSSGQTPGPEGSIGKLAYSKALIRAARFVSDALGPRLIADTGEWGTFAWTELLLATPALRILGGTEEIMKNILAERVLGLPKDTAA